MDPQTDLPDLVEDLEVNIDELTSTLAPILDTPLHTTASSLPLLDKAKLYVLAAYSIESLLFSTLQASGANAKEHALFPELARLKKYFAKIKEVEERAPGGAWEKRARVDTGAAARFIKHGLAGNDRYDAERKERMAREKKRAQEKAKLVNKKFDEEKEEVTPKKRGVDELDEEIPEADDDADADTTAPANKRTRVSASDSMDSTSAPTPATQTKERKQRGKGKKTKQSPETSSADTDDTTTQAPDNKKKRKQRSKPAKAAHNAETDQVTLSSRAPKTRSETFSALVEGKTRGSAAKGKAKGKGK
ncbi:hypothetical protein P153DRAFT_364360 [Dothidotthia symphoricarpi CBS 119687]|uniref:Exosome complex protein n=1 Tax=Dothidotthia symphoricarpi CBS 119687 TaxID=1392245 RepID=A0A6A6AN20_9PLEO|nr:uncharacterized protein P153DRAFT_364360 [Dothidotthia symphoricarpi CBS 119687]KAF2131881.1 hypothetical protein P153DRAFT_364360 [Dothidotthia symphoricarpi CBS 119687]